MKGRRIPDTVIDRIPAEVQAGDYWRVLIDDSDGVRPMNVVEPTNLTGGVWRVAAPMTYGFAIGTLTKHTVREEDDGSISVRNNDGSSNSILITGHDGEQYHGFIERGVSQTRCGRSSSRSRRPTFALAQTTFGSSWPRLSAVIASAKSHSARFRRCSVTSDFVTPEVRTGTQLPGPPAEVSAADFHAKHERRWSPEWDFGVMWTEKPGGYSPWPLWRVSWIIDTGELYAQSGSGRLRLLAVVPPVGEYPSSGNHDAWVCFKDAQTVEKIMEGWAEGDAHKPLSWITDRISRLAC